MKAHFLIISDGFGTVLLRYRRIAKALRWWLRHNRFTYKHNFFANGSSLQTLLAKNILNK
ncbi:MAG: hypothetical protein ABSF81_07515 [Bacteroidales bacterium]